MNKGDVVTLIDEDVSGIVIRVKDDRVSILTDDGFEMEYSRNELVVMNESLSKQELETSQIPIESYYSEIKKSKKSKRVRSKERSLPPMEVDLHIEKLVSNSKRMDSFEILNIQMDTAKRQLEFAIQKRIQKVVFIHGIGEGVLKAELESLFRRYEHMKYYDADFQKYGRGATEVYIFQNKKTGI